MPPTKPQTLTSESELREALEHALDCVLCFCGNHKRIGKPFCFQCWDSIPQSWKDLTSLKTRCSSEDCKGYGHQYDAACTWLRLHYPHRFAS